MITDFCNDGLGDIEASVEHCHNDPEDRKVWVDRGSNSLDGIDKEGKSLEGVVLALDGDDEGVGGSEDIEGEDAERRWCIDENIVVAWAKWLKHMFEAEFPVFAFDEFYFCPVEVGVGGENVEILDKSCANNVLRWRVVDENVIERWWFFCKTDCGGCVGLGVGVDEENTAMSRGKTCREVDSGCAFPNSTFLVNKADYWHRFTLRLLEDCSSPRNWRPRS
jgi:hypothetical protein